MVDFKSLKNSKSSSLEKLTKALEEQNKSGTYQQDDRYWKPVLDKAGNGQALIRFLPAAAIDGEDYLPWVKLWTHGFKVGSQWYIENSLTTLGLADPVSEFNSELWESGVKANQELVSKERKRKLSYISNIYVIDDPKNPENNGKVFLFRYGSKIFDKINSSMVPEFEGDPQVNPFDMWQGANFKLRIRREAGYPNYDLSVFAGPSALNDDDDVIESIWNSLHSLKAVIDPKEFKSYGALKARLERVLGGGTGNVARTVEDASSESSGTGEAPEKPKPVTKSTPKKPVAETVDEDDDLAFFSNLAEGDD